MPIDTDVHFKKNKFLKPLNNLHLWLESLLSYPPA